MSGGRDTRFKPGQSGNRRGRPKKRRQHVPAFEVIFDKTISVTQGGVVRELTIDEGIDLKIYQAALNGNKRAIRKVLKMIHKREKALAKYRKRPPVPVETEYQHDTDNAVEAMRILDIIEGEPLPGGDKPFFKLRTWVTQAALSRPGRRRFTDEEREGIRMFTQDSGTLKWPRRRRG